MATILGLLLVVTFIANYLTTTLPNQMQVNDLNHELQVENQLGRLQAVLEAASAANAIGAQLSQPISLGSVGDPPFANPDGATLSGVPGYGPTAANSSYALTVLGGIGYFAPGGFGAVNPTPPGVCTVSATSLSCGYLSSPLRVNYSLAASSTFAPTLDDGSSLVELNISTNSSTLSFGNIQGMKFHLFVIGNGNTVTVTSNGAVTPTVTILGNNNTLNLVASGGGNDFVVDLVGNDNHLSGPGTAGSTTIDLTTFGVGNTWAISSGGSDRYYVWWNGFNPNAVTSASCPYGGTSTSNSVSGFTGANAATLHEYYNNSSAANNPSTHSGTGLTVTYQTVSLACPYVEQASIPLSRTLAPGAVVVAALANTYIPSAEIALDEGAVTFAQEGGYPVMYESPSIQYTGSALTVWLPQFTGAIGSTYGLGTVDLTFRLLSVQSFDLPATGISVPSSGSFVLTIVSPYAEAWAGWASGIPSLASLYSCTPSSVCTGAYQAPGALGTFTLSIPMAGLSTLRLSVANFAIGIT